MTYFIGELATLLNVSIHTLRYYEKEGLIVPKRTLNNIRVYSEENKMTAEFLLQLKSTGMTLIELKKFISLSADEDYPSLISLLEEHKKKITKQIKVYQLNKKLINRKVHTYMSHLD